MMEIIEGKRVFRSKYIQTRIFLFKNHQSCIFCQNCEDIVLDYDGPYMLICNKTGKDEEGHNVSLAALTEWNKDNKCPYFIDEENKNIRYPKPGPKDKDREFRDRLEKYD